MERIEGGLGRGGWTESKVGAAKCHRILDIGGEAYGWELAEEFVNDANGGMTVKAMIGRTFDQKQWMSRLKRVRMRCFRDYGMIRIDARLC